MSLSWRFDAALQYVSELHRNQVRKGTNHAGPGDSPRPTPYVAHLLEVAGLVLEAGGTEDEAIAALCHDAIEDCDKNGQTREKVASDLSLFGENVVAIVEGCTKVEVDKTASAEQQREQRRDIRKRYYDHLRHASPSVLLVTAADKLHNARAILADLEELGGGVWARFSDTPEQTFMYYENVLRALADAKAPSRLVRELDRVVLGLREHAPMPSQE